MIIKVGDQIIDSTKTPFALAFATKEEAKIVGNIIANIKNGDTKFPDDYNWFIQSSSNMSKEELDKWAVLTDEEKATDKPISKKLRFEL